MNSAVLGGKLMAENTNLRADDAPSKTRQTLALAIEACRAARAAMEQLEADHARVTILAGEAKARVAGSSELADMSASLSSEIATQFLRQGSSQTTGEATISPASEPLKARIQFEVAQRKIRELAAQALAEESRVLAIKLIAAREDAWRLEDELRGFTTLQVQGHLAIPLDQIVVYAAAQDQRPQGMISRNAHVDQAKAWRDYYERLCWDEQAYFGS
jgi:hypothetical protein